MRLSGKVARRSRSTGGRCCALRTCLAPAEHCLLIVRMQRIHDNQRVSDWPVYFTALAEEYGITLYPETLKLMGEAECEP